MCPLLSDYRLCSLAPALPAWLRIVRTIRQSYVAGNLQHECRKISSRLAVAGDLGCSLGPWLTGLVSDLAKQNRLPALTRLIQTPGMNNDEIGLKTGILIAVIFPLLMTAAMISFRKKKKNSVQSNKPN